MSRQTLQSEQFNNRLSCQNIIAHLHKNVAIILLAAISTMVIGSKIVLFAEGVKLITTLSICVVIIITLV